MTFWRAYNLFVARVALFAPDQSNTNKLPVYAHQMSCDNHYYQYTRTDGTNLFSKERSLNNDGA